MIVDIPRTIPGRPLDTPAGMTATPGALGEPDDERVGPGLPEVLSAAFRLDNLIVSAASAEAWRTDRTPDPAWQGAWRQIEGTDLEPLWERFVDADNQQMFDAVSRDIAEEMEARRIIESAPLHMSLPMMLLANIADPTILLPGGALVRGARGGLSAGRSAASVGSWAGMQAAIQEVGLHATQQTRTGEESALNIGGSVLLGGLIGAAGAKLLGRGEWRQMAQAVDRDLAAARTLPDLDEPVIPQPVGMAAMGADVPLKDIDNLTISGRAAGGVARATRWLTPNLRIMHSPSVAARDVLMNLTEMTQYVRGVDRDIPLPQAAETFIKEWDAGLARAVRETTSAFSDYKKRMPRGERLDRAQFREEAGRAARRSDVHDIPEVQRAAEAWRSNVYEPMAKAGMDLKIFPEDMNPKTAASYLMRSWNRERLIAEEPQFKQVAADWMRGNLEADRETAQRLDLANAQLKSWQTEIKRLDARLERAEAAASRTAAKLDERASETIQAERRTETIQERQARIHNESVEIADALELMHDLVQRAPNLSEPMRRAQEQLSRRIAALRGVSAEAAEAGRAATRSGRRLDVLFDRLVDDGARQAVLKEMRSIATTFHDEVRDAIEREIAKWGGDSAKAARAAIAAREARAAGRESDDALLKAASDDPDVLAAVKAAIAEREAAFAKGGRAGPRLRSADKEVDKAVKKIVSQLSGKLSELELETTIRDSVKDVFDKLVGRSGELDRPYMTRVDARGPFRSRTFLIPDEMVERWLDSDIEDIGRRYHRVVAADIELTRKFGSPTLDEQFGAIEADYARLRSKATDGKERTRLTRREEKDKRDLKGLRDMLRGSYEREAWNTSWGKISRNVTMLNYLRMMGGVLLPNLPEAYRGAMVHGLKPYMATLSKLTTAGFKMSVKEGKLSGNITERALSNRLATMYEVQDFYSSRGPIEKFMSNMTNVASTWNGIRIFTDFTKTVGSALSQNRILDTAVRGFEKAGARDRKYLSYVGISDVMAGRIGKMFDEFGETVDGFRIANTEEWTDAPAVRAYRAAFNKDLDSIVVTRSVGDIPLFANTPTGRMLFQFMTFNIAAHQRVLLRGMQEGPARMVSGIIGLVTIGMVVKYLNSVRNNYEVPDFGENPGWWIAEGIDASGLVTVPIQLANAAELLTGFNPVKAPLTAFDRENPGSLRLRNRTGLSVLGPSGQLAEDLATVGGTVTSAIAGNDVTQGQKNAMERLVPFNSYIGLREMFRYVVNARE